MVSNRSSIYIFAPSIFQLHDTSNKSRRLQSRACSYLHLSDRCGGTLYTRMLPRAPHAFSIRYQFGIMSYGNVQANKFLNREYLPSSLHILRHGIIQHVGTCESPIRTTQIGQRSTSPRDCRGITDQMHVKMSHVARSPTDGRN
jgi:hypothetical protein